MHTVELSGRQMVQDTLRIAMRPVERPGMRHDRIIPAADIQDMPRKMPLHEGRAADGIRFTGLGDQLSCAWTKKGRGWCNQEA